MTFLAADEKLFRFVDSLAGRCVWLDALAIFAAVYLVFVTGIMVLWPWVKLLYARVSGAERAVAARTSLAAALAVASTFILNWLVGVVHLRPRPFVALSGVHQLIGAPLTARSFPSGHAAAAFAIAFVVVFARRPSGLFLLVLAAAVAAARVFVGVHYPLDAVGGALSGFLCAVLAARLVGVRRSQSAS
jgi:undecaprenyl-diphosphatase